MDQFKICLLGAHHAGKTSLVHRYIGGTFNETLRKSLGVRIDKKQFRTQAGPLELVIWDMAGANKYQQIQTSYLRNASAYVLVVDGTRSETADLGVKVHEKAQQVGGSLPFLLMVNKCDLSNDSTQKASSEPPWQKLSKSAIATVKTSAKLGTGVNEAFETIALTLQGRPQLAEFE